MAESSSQPANTIQHNSEHPHSRSNETSKKGAKDRTKDLGIFSVHELNYDHQASGKERLLWRFVNFIVVFLVITPFCVAFWRGTWLLFDLYLLPESPVVSAVVSTTIGVVFPLTTLLIQNKVLLCSERIPKPWFISLLWVFYSYPLVSSIVAFWRGVWLLLDITISNSLPSVIISHLTGMAILIWTGTLATVVFTPGYTLRNDLIPFEFNLPVLQIVFFHEHLMCSYVIGSITTVIIIGPATVLYWRGVWLYMDLLTLTEEPLSMLKSGVLSISIGSGICVFCYCFGGGLGKRVEVSSLHRYMKYFIEIAYIYVVGYGAANYWRGFWYIGDVYILKGNDYQALTGLLYHFTALFVLYLSRGTVNIMGAPAGCRMRGAVMLEGFDAGAFIELTQGYRAEVKMNSVEDVKEKTEITILGPTSKMVAPEII